MSKSYLHWFVQSVPFQVPPELFPVEHRFIDLDGECRIQIFSWVMGGPIGRALTSAFNFVPRVFFARGLAKRPSPKVLMIYFVPWQDRKRRVATVT